jgi:hypothetical protein
MRSRRVRWWWYKDIPRATHAGILKIGDAEIPCYVLENGERVLSTRGIMKSLGRSWRGKKYAGTQLPVFLEAINLKPFLPKELGPVLNPKLFRTDKGGVLAEGYSAEILPVVCETYLAARDAIPNLPAAQKIVAKQCEILTRGFARLGIIALIDEVTGYQEVRAKDALTRILEEFIAKELQPYIPTFQDDYYKEIFRLRGLDFPQDTVKRPQYFGSLTNDIVYKRLAPGVLEELKSVTPRLVSGRHKNKLFQRLTANKGYPKLREHLGAVVTMMQLSDDWHDFMKKLDRLRPRLDLKSIRKGEQLSFNYDSKSDPGTGL